MKFKGATNKRLKIDCWGFAMSQMGQGHLQESDEPVKEEHHAKVFCYMQSKSEKLKEVLSPLMMNMLENAVISID